MIAVFGHDPRVYQTTVTEFIKDKNGNVCQAKLTGDMHRGQSLVIWTIREGREAAKAVDESLMGYSYL